MKDWREDSYFYTALVFWVLLFLMVFKGVFFPMKDVDLWWHLTAGRHMVENLEFLRADVFSHTLEGASWINFEWLSQIVLYLAMDNLGLISIFVGKIFLSLISFALLVLCARTAGARGPWLWLLSFAGMMVLRTRLFERVELVTLILMPVFIVLLLKARSFTLKYRTWVPYILAGLMVVWVNMHAGFIYGLGVVALFNIGARLSKSNGCYIRLLNRSLVLVLASTLINPYGPRLYEMFVEVSGQLGFARDLIPEWATTSFLKTPFFSLLLLLSFGLLVAGFVRGWKEARFWAGPVLVFGIWGAMHGRNAALFVFLAVPFLSEVLGRFSLKNFSRVGWALCLVPVIVHVPLMAGSFPKTIVNWDYYPVRSCRFVADKNIQGTMYNDFGTGGFISWVLPGHPVFMDTRYLFFPYLLEESRIEERMAMEDGDGGWENYLSSNNVDHAISKYVPHIEKKFPSKFWALVFWDDSALVYIKRVPKHLNIIRRFEYKSVVPYDLERMEDLLKKGLVKRGPARKELKRHRRETGESRIGRTLRTMVM